MDRRTQTIEMVQAGESEREAIEKRLRYRVPEIRMALIREREPAKLVAIRTPEDTARFLEPLRFYESEHFVALHLSVLNEVTGFRICSHGTLTSSLVHPREIFKAAIVDNAHSLIVAHNHPAGSRTATGEDLATTRTLIESGRLLSIEVIDHLIITPKGGWTSIREDYGYLWD